MIIQKFFSVLALVAVLLTGTDALAAHDMNKKVSKVSEINSMDDDAVVYIQGYIIQNLGDENYVFQDDTGSINIEIDDDLISENTIAPETVVWIAATVDKDGDITSLEAEELVFVPNNTVAGNMNNTKNKAGNNTMASNKPVAKSKAVNNPAN